MKLENLYKEIMGQELKHDKKTKKQLKEIENFIEKKNLIKNIDFFSAGVIPLNDLSCGSGLPGVYNCIDIDDCCFVEV